jgi:LmbE family N-acetylglucosaminyl deacetylase
VLSPHLDDAALSLGAAIACWSRSGADVTVLTVFGGEPDSERPAAPWDVGCGFATAGEAVRARFAEEDRACAILGATSVRLPFWDVQNVPDEDLETRDRDAIWAAVAECIASAELVLAPGHPLTHRDHAWLAQLVAERMADDPRLAWYVEQPYANQQLLGRGYRSDVLVPALRMVLRLPAERRAQTPPPDVHDGRSLTWAALPSSRAARRAKRDSIRAYRSQLDSLHGRLLERIGLYEWCWGGEGAGLPDNSRGAAR